MSKANKNNVVYDDISGYGMTILNNDMYLVKDGSTMKLSTVIVKERNNKREEN